VPILDRQFGITVEARVAGVDLWLDQLALSRSSRWTLAGGLGSSVSIAEANGCINSGQESSLTQSGVPQRLQ